MKTSIILVGSGEFAREVAAMILYTELTQQYDLLGYVSENHPKDLALLQAPYLGEVSMLKALNAELPSLAVAICIGNPVLRSKVFQQIEHLHLFYPNIIHPKSFVDWENRLDLAIGMGNIITEGCIFTTAIQLGDFNILNLGCLVGHDVRFSSFCTVMHGAKFSGGAVIGDRVLVDTGSAFIRKCEVPSNSIVPAYSVVRGDFIP
jgi:acetyltransferase-like isoleucine patch superfamily enzyme